MTHHDTAREFLRIATQKVEEAHHARKHFIYLARDYGLDWASIAHETGLSVPTCRSYADDYLEQRRQAVAA